MAPLEITIFDLKFDSFLFLSHKTDLAVLSFWRSHELTDSVKDHLKLRIVLLFQCGKLLCQLGVGGNHPSQPDKCSHDFDVHLSRPLAPKNPLGTVLDI